MNVTEMKAEIERLTKSVADLEVKLKASEDSVLELKSEASTASSALTEATDKVSALSQAVLEMKASNDKLQAEAKTASQRALEIAAAAGVKPVQGENKEGDPSEPSVYQKFASITDHKARAEFYAKNREALIGKN